MTDSTIDVSFLLLTIEGETIDLNDLSVSIEMSIKDPTLERPSLSGGFPIYYSKYKESIYVLKFVAPKREFRIYAVPGTTIYWEDEELQHKWHPFNLGLNKDIYLQTEKIERPNNEVEGSTSSDQKNLTLFPYLD